MTETVRPGVRQRHGSGGPAILLMVLMAAPVGAQTSASPHPDPVTPDGRSGTHLFVPLLEGRAPQLDGRLDDEAWRGAAIARDFVQSEPSPGEAAGDPTEVRVLRSGNALYVAARMHDTSPQGVHGPLARRDEDVASDWFIVYLDPGGDGRTAVGLAVNPRGVKRDFRIGEDGREDPEWRAIWDAAASVDAEGWAVELRIPFSQILVGTATGGDGRWGANFQRHQARTGEVSSWAPFPRNVRQVVSSFGRLEGLDGVSSPLRLELIPYSMGRAAVPSDGPDDPGALFGTVGGEVRAGLPGNLEFAATFNPDFGQVEADPAVVNVSGYRTFFPEKRPFFLEEEPLFTQDIGRTRIFHSRRIGRDVQPTAATRSSFQRVPDASGILAASRLTGRTPGGWTVGVLHALTNAEMRVTQDSVGVEELEPVEPRTNYVVARLARSFRDGRESVGGFATLTHRDLRGALDEELPSRAYAGGGTWYRQSETGAFELSGTVVGSLVQGSPSVIRELQQAHGRYLQRPDAGHLHFDSLQTSLTGVAAEGHVAWQGEGNWAWSAGGHLLSPGFEVNDLGHQRESDLVHQFMQISWDRLGEGVLLRRRRVTLTQWSDWSFGRERLSTGGRGELQVQFRNFWTFILQGERHLAALGTDELRGGPGLLMPASSRARGILVTDRRRAVNLRLDGSLIREEETAAMMGIYRATLEARPAGRLLLALEPSLVDRMREVHYVARVNYEGETRFLFGRADQRTLSLVSRADLALTPTLSLQLYAQPYLVTREVDDVMEVANPRGSTFSERFRSYGASNTWIDPESERVQVDRSGDGSADFSIPDPSFTYGQLSSNVVLRWEYRPGSTLFLVWSRDVRDRASSGSLHPVEGFTDLLGLGRPLPAPPTNLFLIKATFWLGS
jgi:hypothetical protein